MSPVSIGQLSSTHPQMENGFKHFIKPLFPKHSILVVQPGILLQYSFIYAVILLGVAVPLTSQIHSIHARP